jgi:hypothetical protein
MVDGFCPLSHFNPLYKETEKMIEETDIIEDENQIR